MTAKLIDEQPSDSESSMGDDRPKTIEEDDTSDGEDELEWARRLA